MYEIPGASPLDQVRVEQVRRRPGSWRSWWGNRWSGAVIGHGARGGAPLIEIIGGCSRMMLAGYLGPGRRFASERQLAAYAGVAPPK
ncbi:MAG: hypothetical protein R2849_12840 [Thermomicrobiales bacterium]